MRVLRLGRRTQPNLHNADALELSFFVHLKVKPSDLARKREHIVHFSGTRSIRQLNHHVGTSTRTNVRNKDPRRQRRLNAQLTQELATQTVGIIVVTGPSTTLRPGWAILPRPRSPTTATATSTLEVYTSLLADLREETIRILKRRPLKNAEVTNANPLHKQHPTVDFLTMHAINDFVRLLSRG